MKENKYKIPFNAALANSGEADAEMLDELVNRYPYVQSLRVVQAMRAAQASSQSSGIGISLLYVGSPHHLQAMLYKPNYYSDAAHEDDILAETTGEWPIAAIDEVSALSNAITPDTPQIFRIDDPEAEAADQMQKAEEQGAGDMVNVTAVSVREGEVYLESEEQSDTERISEPESAIDTPTDFVIETVVPESHADAQSSMVDEGVFDDVTSETSHGGAVSEEVTGVIIEHPVALDYLVYEDSQISEETPVSEVDDTSKWESEDEAEEIQPQVASNDEEPQQISSDQQVIPASQARPHEKVSIYDDEHMPYSFLWWLNKARMEHASTYQPYATSEKQTQHQPIRQAGDQVLLDQQIRENIFHLQPPEEKLTAGNEGQTVSFKVPQKMDPIIERFIREEPQIKPPNPEKLTLKNMAKHSAEDTQEIVTETLAKIYADQGHYNKAIDAYKKLSLKYPEKSSYFAGRISDLEKKFN